MSLFADYFYISLPIWKPLVTGKSVVNHEYIHDNYEWAHYPTVESFLFSTCQPSTPQKSFQKNKIVVLLVSWVCFSPWQHVCLKNRAKPCPHTHASARVKPVDFQSKEELLEAVTHPWLCHFSTLVASHSTNHPVFGKKDYQSEITNVFLPKISNTLPRQLQ